MKRVLPIEMQLAAKFLLPYIALMLGVKHCHTNACNTLEAIPNEKSLLLRSLGCKAIAVINQNDSFVAETASNLQLRAHSIRER